MPTRSIWRKLSTVLQQTLRYFGKMWQSNRTLYRWMSGWMEKRSMWSKYDFANVYSIFSNNFNLQHPCYRLFLSNNLSLLTECDGNMFGKHCKEVCGKFLNGGQCHHINGSCLYGCNPGYYGIDCREGTDT